MAFSQGSCTYTAPQLDNAFADYFKHREQWVGAWEKLPKVLRETAAVIMTAGATRSSTGNFRTAAEVLGNPGYASVSVFGDALQAWEEELQLGRRNS